MPSGNLFFVIEKQIDPGLIDVIKNDIVPRYKKNCTDLWAEEEFNAVKTTTATGERVEMKLAERGVCLGKSRFLVKEVRKLTGSGHQTTIICTAKKLKTAQIAPGMFARWFQENYFAYAMHPLT